MKKNILLGRKEIIIVLYNRQDVKYYKLNVVECGAGLLFFE